MTRLAIYESTAATLEEKEETSTECVLPADREDMRFILTPQRASGNAWHI